MDLARSQTLNVVDRRNVAFRRKQKRHILRNPKTSRSRSTPFRRYLKHVLLSVLSHHGSSLLVNLEHHRISTSRNRSVTRSTRYRLVTSLYMRIDIHRRFCLHIQTVTGLVTRSRVENLQKMQKM